MNFSDTSSLDEVPLAYLYPSYTVPQAPSNDAVLQLEDVVNPPPEYQDTETPPAYQTKSQSVPPTKIHRLAYILVNCDLVENFVLLATTLISLVSNPSKDAYLAMLVPIIFISLAIIGRSSYKRRRPITMLLYCGTYLARWCGDASVCVYTYVTQYTEYYDMNVYTFFVTYLMVGIRGFYLNLFPCYHSSSPSECESAGHVGQNLISAPILFLLILFPQLLFGVVLIYDAMFYFDMDLTAEYGDE